MATEEATNGVASIKIPYSVLSLISLVVSQTLLAVWWAAGFSATITTEVLEIKQTTLNLKAEAFTRGEAALLIQRLDQQNAALNAALTNRIAEIQSNIQDIRMDISTLAKRR